MTEEEFQELFVAESLDIIEKINTSLTQLEKSPGVLAHVDEVLRNLHTLKGNAMGVGAMRIADFSHLIEEIFGEIKKDRTILTNDLFQTLFQSIDKLEELITALSSGEEVQYKGFQRKLKVLAKSLQEASVSYSTAQTEQVQDAQNNSAPERAESGQTEQQGLAGKKKEDTTVLEPVTDQHTEIVAEEEEKSLLSNDQPGGEKSGKIAPNQQKNVEQNSDTSNGQLEEVVENESKTTKVNFSETIQVTTRKADDLLALIGELMIERDTVASDIALQDGSAINLNRLNRIVSDLQYGIMNIRLVKVGTLFSKFTRILRDVTKIEQKEVELVLEGTEIEIDRNILKAISDAMVHLVRNAVSHGIEAPDVRLLSGKPKQGKVTLKAYNENDNVVIQVSDDGHGIDSKQILKKAIKNGLVDTETAQSLSQSEILMFIFEPGFSNAKVVNEVSGRGVGMDVVKRATESIGGQIDVKTDKGQGTTISLNLPSSLAVKGALLFRLNQQEFAITINYTESVVSMSPSEINRLPKGYVTKYLGKPIPVVFLTQLFDHPESFSVEDSKKQLQAEKVDVIVVRHHEKLLGFVVDKLLMQQEIVEKALTGILSDSMFFKTATILGNGNVCLILDIPSVFKLMYDKGKIGKQVA